LTACTPPSATWQPAPPAARTVPLGLLLRRQVTPDICASRPYRHLDTLLPNGKIYGFNTAETENSFLHNIVFRSRGLVRDNPRIRQDRQHYIAITAAKNFSFHGEDHLKMITDWAEFHITPTQAAALEIAWENLKADTPQFRLAGMNCATRAQECLVAAKILPPHAGIPGIDRPENLIKFVQKYYPETRVHRGYFGLDENGIPQLEIAGAECE
jgi:hypothetical protein